MTETCPLVRLRLAAVQPLLMVTGDVAMLPVQIMPLPSRISSSLRPLAVGQVMVIPVRRLVAPVLLLTLYRTSCAVRRNELAVTMGQEAGAVVGVLVGVRVRVGVRVGVCDGPTGVIVGGGLVGARVGVVVEAGGTILNHTECT